jgi:hypothetical protein
VSGQPARDHAELGVPEPFGECLRELLFPVAHDRDPGRLDTVAQQFPRQERSIQVAPVAANELAAGDDDEPARTGGHTAGRMPRGVTIRVFTPPTGRRRVRPFKTVTRFSGRSSVIHSFFAVKSCVPGRGVPEGIARYESYPTKASTNRATLRADEPCASRQGRPEVAGCHLLRRSEADRE